MKKLAAVAAYAIILSSPAFASGSTDITTKTYSGSRGTTTVITNSAARNESIKIDRYRNGGKLDYPKYSPKTAESQDSDGKGQLPTPYSHMNTGYGGGSLGQILVTMRDGSELDIAPIIMLEARKNNVDPYLIRTIIKYESGFCPFAVSPVGAGGLMQLMPDTARGLGVSDLFSPHQNIAAGTLYIRRQLDAFNNNVAFALAAYNAGPGAVIAYGGVPPYSETINYVNMIMSDYRKGSSGAVRPAKKAEAKQEEKEKAPVDVYTTLDRMRKLTSGNER